LTDSIKENGVEILCIGTELLLGNIINSNAKWISEELASLGLTHYRQTVIGDNYDRLKNELIEASKRSRILITTGGLGPTPDDLTTEVIASAFNTVLEERKEILEDIQQKLGPKISFSNCNIRKQALVPKGSKIIPNSRGTAPGIIWSPKEDFTIITFPGVPSEMKSMWTQSAVEWFKKFKDSECIIISKILHFAGISESTLTEKIGNLINNKNPTVAPYASLGEVKLRITAKAQDARQANQLIQPIEDQILLIAGNKYFGFNEDSLASVVIQLLRNRGETLAVAESCTGGGIGAAITSISGSSDVFLGGIIAYHNSIKQNLLSVSEHLIKEDGAVSNQVTEAMASGVINQFNSDWSIAISGIAGPTGEHKSKKIGLVKFSIAGPFGVKSSSESFNPYIGRTGIQKLSVLKALNELRLFLLSKS
tara:strand:- start:25720 stop:26991 length:1272 start_codon:yes stop_codon:yes gene_type:complete